MSRCSYLKLKGCNLLHIPETIESVHAVSKHLQIFAPQVTQFVTGCAHITKAMPFLSMISWINNSMKIVSHTLVNSICMCVLLILRNLSNNITLCNIMHKISLRDFIFVFPFSKFCKVCTSVNSNFCVKIVKNFFSDMVKIIIFWHKITLLILSAQTVLSIGTVLAKKYHIF